MIRSILTKRFLKGPTNWVGLDPAANAVCATGTRQSPIDMLPDAHAIVPAAELSLTLTDHPEGAEFENLGTTIEVIAATGEGEAATPGGTMSFGGVDYGLEQFHFHLPSEHLDNGQTMAMEMHMVWESEAGDVAVVGVFIDLDDSAAAGTASVSSVSSVNETESATITRRSFLEKQARRKVSQEQSKQRRQLPTIENSFFHINAPTTAATTASTLLETVLGAAGDIAEPGTLTTTQPLVMSELATVLNAGSFQT